MKFFVLRLTSIFLCFLLMLGAITCCAQTEAGSQTQAQEYERLFEKDHIMKVEIEISEEDWQSMLENPTLEEYHSATVTVDGETVENVGIRTKGNSSLSSVANSDSDRYSFRIKFGKYEKKQKLLGLDEMVLNSNFADSSYLREYLSYEALREIGSPAPLSAFAEIYINGERFGFYLAVEAADDSFLKRNFGDDNGNLYKADMGSSLVYQEGSNYDSLELKKGSDTEKTGLKKLIQTLNEMPDGEKGGIEDILDVDSALSYIAANTVLGNYDSYNGSMLQNYYLYEQDGKFTVIPWDYNMSIGGYMGSSQSGTTIPIDEPVFGVSMDKTPLITNLLEVEQYKERYYEYIRELLSYLEGFEERVDEIADQIRPYVEVDPTKFVTMEDFESAITYNENEASEPSMGGMTPPGSGGFMPPDGMEGGQSQMPDGMVLTGEDQKNKPAGQENGSPPELPDGVQPGDANATPPSGGNMGGRPNEGGPGGGGDRMMQGTGGSIINFVRARVENLEKQLSGELETTGNTTMNNPMGGGPGGGRPNGNGGGTPITVLLDGNRIRFDQQPVIQNNRTLVPIRAIFEALSIELVWEETTQTVTAAKDGEMLTFVIGQAEAVKDGQPITMEVPAQIIGDRTMVPLRFLTESFGITAAWDETTRTVTLSTQESA